MNMNIIKTYIETLTGDAGCEKLTWQTIPEGKSTTKPMVIHGSVVRVFEQLKKENLNGSGIFLTVNETDLLGRKTDNVIGVRSFFVDKDNGEFNLDSLPLKPSMVVRTERGHHAYWRASDCELSYFTPIQVELIKKLDTDPSAKDLPRVFRVPGTWQCKNEPVMVKLVSADKNLIYTTKQFCDGFGIKVNGYGATHQNSNIAKVWSEPLVGNSNNKKYGLSALDSAVRAVVSTPKGNRNNILFAQTAAIAELAAGGEIDPIVARNTMDRAGKTVGLEQNRIDRTLDSAFKTGSLTPRTRTPLPNYRERPALLKTNDDGSTEMIEQISIDIDDGNRKKTPNEIALEIMTEHYFLSDCSKNIYKFNGKTWEQYSDDMIKSLALQKDSQIFTNRNRRSETVDRILCDPSVVRNDIEFNNIEINEIALNDCVLNVLTGATRPHCKDNLLENLVDVKYDPDAISPTLSKCLNDWFHNDKDRGHKILALQEFAGYVLFNHAKFKKALFVYGQSNTGKSVFGQILELLVGKKLCCSIGIESMDDSRKLAPIKGKKLNLITELPDEALIADGGFKKLVSSEDSIQIDAKYKNPEIYNPICKHVVCTNTLPDVNDKTRATYNRLLIVEFLNVIDEKNQDPFIIDKIKEEIQGVLNWAIIGAKRLSINKGIFTKIESSEERIEQYRIEQNPVLELINDKFEIGPSFHCSYPSFYKIFCDVYGWKIEKKKVGKALDALGFERKSHGSERHVFGIRLK